MVRPIHADAAATRRRILEAASQLFADLGQTASLRSVAQEAGCAVATVLHYYGSKAELYRASVEAMDEALGALYQKLPRVLAAAESIDDAIELAVRGALNFARGNRHAVRLRLRASIESGGMGENRRQRFLLPVLDEVGALLSDRLDRSEVECRMALISMHHLIVRFALTDSDELVAITGANGEDAGSQALETMDAYLVEIARRRFGLDERV